MAEPSQQQQTTGQFTGGPPATPPLGEQSPGVSPSVASQPVILSSQPSGQSSNTPQQVQSVQRKQRVIVTAVAAVLICLAVGWVLWWNSFPWYVFVGLPAILLVIGVGYIFKLSWVGVVEYVSPPHAKNRDFQPSKTFWDWLQLLIIPVILAAGALWFNAQQGQMSQHLSDLQHQTGLQIAQDQQQATALQTYLDRMSDLLLVDNLRKSKSGDEVRQVARARTLTVLRSLDPARKGYLLQFLYEANLINKNEVIVELSGADLSGADLKFANLSGADLSGADLKFANLSYADLTGAILHRAKLSFANLYGTILKKADLSLASFYKAEVTNKQLAETPLLTGTILPDGSIHP